VQSFKLFIAQNYLGPETRTEGA